MSTGSGLLLVEKPLTAMFLMAQGLQCGRGRYLLARSCFHNQIPSCTTFQCSRESFPMTNEEKTYIVNKFCTSAVVIVLAVISQMR